MNGTLTDQFGSIASTLCALHCLLLSTLPWLISLLGIELLAHEAFEWGFFSVAILFGLAATVTQLRRSRSAWLIAAFALGLLVLSAGRLVEALALFEGGGVLAILGGGVLATSHLISLRRHRKDACCA